MTLYYKLISHDIKFSRAVIGDKTCIVPDNSIVLFRSSSLMGRARIYSVRNLTNEVILTNNVTITALEVILHKLGYLDMDYKINDDECSEDIVKKKIDTNNQIFLRKSRSSYLPTDTDRLRSQFFAKYTILVIGKDIDDGMVNIYQVRSGKIPEKIGTIPSPVNVEPVLVGNSIYVIDYIASLQQYYYYEFKTITKTLVRHKYIHSARKHNVERRLRKSISVGSIVFMCYIGRSDMGRNTAILGFDVSNDDRYHLSVPFIVYGLFSSPARNAQHQIYVVILADNGKFYYITGPENTDKSDIIPMGYGYSGVELPDDVQASNVNSIASDGQYIVILMRYNGRTTMLYTYNDENKLWTRNSVDIQLSKVGVDSTGIITKKTIGTFYAYIGDIGSIGGIEGRPIASVAHIDPKTATVVPLGTNPSYVDMFIVPTSVGDNS